MVGAPRSLATLESLLAGIKDNGETQRTFCINDSSSASRRFAKRTAGRVECHKVPDIAPADYPASVQAPR